MLTRLSLRLENDFNPKQKTREEIEKQPALQKAAPVYVSREIKGADGKTEALEIDEDFDRAWRRVGVGHDRVFSRWFSKEKPVDAPLYRVKLVSDGNKTTVTAMPDSDKTDPLSTSARILNLLQEQVR